MNDLAKKAYEAWCAVMSPRGQVVEVAFPRFEQLAPIERQAWIAAANAVEDWISQARVP